MILLTLQPYDVSATHEVEKLVFVVTFEILAGSMP